MIEPIVIRFATAGIPEVSAAFARVSTQAKKFEDAMVGASEKGARARVNNAEKEARDKIRAMEKTDKLVAKIEREQTVAQERELKRRADIVRRSSEMAGRDAIKAAKEEAREIERINAQSARDYIKFSE